MPFWGDGLQPAPPAGYDYDVINTDVLLHRTKRRSGRAHPHRGQQRNARRMSYRVLALAANPRR